MITRKKSHGFSVKAYQGDCKTLLAFDLTQPQSKNLAGFTLQCRPGTGDAYYLYNFLRFADPSKHVQDAAQSSNSSLNAPIHKFRWVHVPGSVHQGTEPFFGPYTYTVTPRYFGASGSLQAIDPSLSVSVKIKVGPFAKGKIATGFTRGFVQSQAFVHHFGPQARFRPPGKDLLFDTAQLAGKNSAGETYTFAEEYEWLGFSARDRIFALLDAVLANPKLTLDVFAYDLNEVGVMTALLKLAAQGRVRVILDDAALHHNPKAPKPEDQFEQQFNAVAKSPAALLRGHFGRYAHDKVFIVSNAAGPRQVLTGSTNFSITGLYVNSNHVLVFNDARVAAAYAEVFAAAWADGASMQFAKTPAAARTYSFSGAGVAPTDLTFSPHLAPFAAQTLDAMAARITAEQQAKDGSVLFAVMGLATGTGPVLPALQALHADEDIFSYGISDTPDGIFLYTPRRKTGVLVSGKPTKTKLPPPFDQVPGLGLGHQVHHKFVVCGFNGPDPVVYCGSSNLALAGEQVNGDNLLAIRDRDIATVFAIEALALVDHFDFLDRSAASAKAAPADVLSASRQQQAADAGWFLSTTDRWARPYYDSNDLHCVDRELFG